MAMTVSTGRLSSVASHVAQMMKQAGNGPLAVSKDVCALADEWANYKEEAGGQTCSQWLLGVSGQNEKFFRLRATAVDRIGEHARRSWDHLAAVWALGFDDISLARLDRQVRAEQTASGGALFSQARVQRVARELGIVRPCLRKRVCADCQERDKTIQRLQAIIDAR